MTRREAIAACRDLERRFIRLGQDIGASWAHQWANTLLDTRQPVALYANWIAQQQARCERYERKAT